MASFPPPNSMFVLFFFLALAYIPISSSVPFAVFPGIGDSCSSKGVTYFTELLTKWSGCQGYCIEIGDGSWDSWVMSLMEQTAIACEKVKNMSELSDGYNMVGLSQGNMVARGVIEFCDGGPTVKNYVSIAGPHAGIASIPLCGSTWVCLLVDYLIELGVYSAYVQKHLAPSNYVKIPTDFNSYMEGCKFLPKLNNEAINMRNSTYKERFASLESLVLIMFEQDTVLVPRETSWFGYYPDGSFDTVLPANETKLYTEDWIGLKTLDEAGKVQFIGVPGNHLAITESVMKNYVVPYLEDESSTRPKPTKSEDNRWASAFCNFIERIVRFTQNEPLFGHMY